MKFKHGKAKITNDSLSKVMYAIILTKAKLHNTFCLGLPGNPPRTRSQATGYFYEFIIEVSDPDLFTELSGVDLIDVPQPHLNNKLKF